MAQREAPYIPQMEAVECGAACLTMVLAAHGHHAPLSEVRAACGVSRDGVTLKKIVEAARSYGLSTKAQRLEPAELAGVVTPAILHWEMNHFVVLRRWTPTVVHLLDPAVGPREIPPEEFDRSFTGICVSLAPTPEFRKRAPQRTSLGRYLRTLGATWGALSLVLSASLLLNVMGLAVPLSTKLVVDHVLARGQTAWLEIIVLAALGAVAAQALVGVTRAAVLTALKRHLDIAMTLGFVRHLLSLPLPFLAQRSIGDLMNRVQSNKMLRDLLAGQAVAGLVDGLLLVSYLGLMLWLDAPLGAIVAGAGAAYCVLYAITRPGQFALLQERQVKDVKEQDQLIQIVRGMMTVKSAGSEVAAHTRWLNALVRALNARIRESRAQDGVGVALFAIRALVPVIVLALGAHRVMRGELTLGTLLGFQVLQLGFLAPLETVIQTLMRLQVMPVLMQRMDDILAAEPEPTGGAPCPRIEGRVTFEDVSFRYGLQSPLVLDGISFSIEKGQKIGLVGASGSGKSTIAKLLLGMFRPVSGRITVDGQDLASLDLASLRRQCGMVLQEAALFEGSVRENISLYHPNAPIEDVVAAARLAQIHDDIESLPKGYETRISASSGLFSGGQRQRLALARAVLHRPPIMILDEATSALDAVTESAIERYLSTRECTRIVIAHRLNTVRDADVILVLRDGRVAERGRYDELVEQGGFFAELVARGGATAQGPSRTGPPRVEAADLSPMRGLEGMTPDERDALADALQRTRHAAGDTIVTQGDRPAGLFLIEEGAVDVTIDEPGLPPFTVARLGPGDLFGELGLLGSAPNSASVVAVEATRVLHLPQEEFQELRRRGDLLAVRLTLVLGRLVASRLREAGARLGEADGTEDQPALAPDALAPPAGSDLADGAPRARRRRARELALAQTPFGASLSDDERAFLEFVGTLEHPGEGEVLFREGDAGDEVFLLLGGRVGVERAGVRGYLRVIKPGDLFGELALFDDAPRSATCVVLEPAAVLSFPAAALAELFESGHPAAQKLLAHVMQTVVFSMRVANARLREAVATSRGEHDHAFRAREEAVALARRADDHDSDDGARRGVPLVRASRPELSAAACVASLLRHHRRPVPLASVEEACAVNGAITQESLTRAARGLGLEIRRLELSLDDLRDIDAPLVLRLARSADAEGDDGGVYVVADRWTRGGLPVMDPTAGRRTLSTAELKRRFAGLAYDVSPTKVTARPRPPIERLLEHVAERRGPIAHLVAVTVLFQLTSLVVPFATAAVINQVLPSRHDALLHVLAAALGAAVVVQALLTFQRDATLRYLRMRFDLDMMNQMMGHLLSLPIAFFEVHRPGAIVQRFQSFRVLRDLLTNQGVTALLDVGTLLVSLVALAWVDARLFVPIAVVLVLFIVVLGLLAPRIERWAAEELEHGADQQSRLIELLGSIATLHAAAVPEGGLGRWRPAFLRELRASARQDGVVGAVGPLLDASRLAALVVLLWRGAVAVQEGSLSLGALLAAAGVAATFLSTLSAVAAQVFPLARGAAHLRGIRHLLAERTEQTEALPAPPGKLRGRITLDRVSFRYAPDGATILRDVSLEIVSGTKVALVGPSGSGKSTLGKLLLGFYPPSSGRVLFDGRDIARLDLPALRRQVGVVLQEPYLFNASIRTNLSLNAPAAKMSEIMEAARRAAIHDEIAKLPMHYETLVSEGGGTFSGGQRQRLAIARALVHAPALLFLDEATSALDNVSQGLVEAGLADTRCTRIVIAHRLSTVADADLVVALDKGRIVETGRHAELMERRGFYWNLVRAQEGVG